MEYHTASSGVTEGAQVVRANRPGKATAAQVKTMFSNEGNMHLH